MSLKAVTMFTLYPRRIRACPPPSVSSITTDTHSVNDP